MKNGDIQPSMDTSVRGGGGVLESVLLGMCRWPLRSPPQLWSILWPIIDPILVTVGQMCHFRILNLVTFYPGGGGGLPYETDGDARRKF